MKIGIKLISAVSMNGAIGKNNDLLWRIPEDLKHFKEMTLNEIVVVGLNTWFSLPDIAKKNRQYVIINGGTFILDDNIKKYDTLQYPNLEDFMKDYLIYQDVPQLKNKFAFIAGGGYLYKTAIEYCDEAYITWVNEIYEDADVYFPIDKLKEIYNYVEEDEWKLSKTNYLYKICKYTKQ